SGSLRGRRAATSRPAPNAGGGTTQEQVSIWVSIILGLLGRGKRQRISQVLDRCLSPVVLKSLGPLALLGSTPSPGTMLSVIRVRVGPLTSSISRTGQFLA